eukprot:353330-Chlamydomonas_euryale.AAC.1
MKEFKMLMAYCEELGMTLKHNNAKRHVATIEPFVVSPSSYKAVYEFYAVHNMITRGDDIFHEVYVPNMPSAFGTGDTLDEAMAAASEMLGIAIDDMQSRGDPIPEPNSFDQVKDEGVADEAEEDIWFSDKTQFIEVVTVKSIPRSMIPKKSKEELDELERETRVIWEEVCKEARKCVMADPDEHETAALTQPTVCALTGFNTVHDALQFVPHRHVPYVMLRAHHGYVTHVHEKNDDDTEAVRYEPEMALLYTRTLNLRVFVLCDTFTDLTPKHRTCVSHIISAPASCAAFVPMCSDALWLNLETMRFAFRS